MPLSRGPFKLLPDDALGLTPPAWDFEQWATDQLGDIQGFLEEAAPLIVDVSTTDMFDPVPEMDDGLPEAWISGANDWLDLMATRQDELDQAAAIGDQAYVDTENSAPPGTWDDAPAPFTPPDTSGETNITPPPPTGGGDDTTGSKQRGSPVIKTIPEPAGYGFELLNQTEYGSQYFNAADAYHLIVRGPAGQKVHAKGWKDSEYFGDTPFGTIAADGTFTMDGHMGPEDVGHWVEEFYADSTLVQRVEFDVLPAT